jgi:hypothetical protein
VRELVDGHPMLEQVVGPMLKARDALRTQFNTLHKKLLHKFISGAGSRGATQDSRSRRERRWNRRHKGWLASLLGSACRAPVSSRSRAASLVFGETTHRLFSTIGKSRSRDRHGACRLVDDRVPLGLPLDLRNWHLNTGLNAYQKRPVTARRGCQTSTCDTRMANALRESPDDGWGFWFSRRSRHMIRGHISSAL